MGCLFCSIGNHKSAFPEFPEETILDESENFYAKPALGQFIEGYTLIFSKRHVNSFSKLTDAELEELVVFKEKISTSLKKAYGNSILCFEHGMLNHNLKAGSCIDHAHCHIVPVEVDIIDDLRKIFPNSMLANLKSLPNALEAGFGYLYLQSENDKEYVFNVMQGLPSQFVRKLIAHKLGLSNEWDWRVYPFRENIKVFINKYKLLCQV